MRSYFIAAATSVLVILIFFSSCSEEEVKYQRYYADGSQVYKVHCESCHMKDGSGLENIIPPLTDTTFLKKHRSKLPCFIAYGLKDTIEIHGIIYDTEMPAERHLAAIDIAKVLTYITNTFGNQQGIYDVKEVEMNINKCR
jgi:mono/diheme cytochrome c family protein